VGLYEEPEKPENPVDFIKQFLGSASDVDVEALKGENEALKQRVEELQAKLELLAPGSAGNGGGGGGGTIPGTGAGVSGGAGGLTGVEEGTA
jgi:hypothetical protein